MAGPIKVDMFTLPHQAIIDLVARQCAVTGKYGPICQRYDAHTGQNLWCPLMYGLRIFLQSRYAGEVRTPEDAAHWMATHELQETRYYLVMCLALEREQWAPGATMPR